MPGALRFALLCGLTLSLGACGPEEGADRRPGSMDGRMGPGMMSGMMENMPEGIPASALPDPGSRGARLVARYCAQCHAISSPGRLSAAEWPSTLERMVARMERMQGMGGMMERMMGERMGDIEAPDREQRRVILEYLQSHALRAASEEDLPGEGPAVALFARTCSRCHALPDPGQYPAEAWSDVVERMREHMGRMDVDGITDDEAEAITRYLRRAAADPGQSR